MKQYKKTVLTLLAMLIIGACYSCRDGGREYYQEETDAADAGTGGTAEGWDVTEGSQASEETAGAVCFVYVCGEVKNPGVYEVSAGSRVYELIGLAGGMTDDAAPEALNLAETVADGMKLMMPDAETASEAAELAGVSNGVSSDGRVDLNRADKETLKTLPGIGDARAEAILKYRSEHGDFSRIEDIMKVPGIKSAAFEKLKDYVTV